MESDLKYHLVVKPIEIMHDNAMKDEKETKAVAHLSSNSSEGGESMSPPPLFQKKTDDETEEGESLEVGLEGSQTPPPLFPETEGRTANIQDLEWKIPGYNRLLTETETYVALHLIATVCTPFLGGLLFGIQQMSKAYPNCTFGIGLDMSAGFILGVGNNKGVIFYQGRMGFFCEFSFLGGAIASGGIGLNFTALNGTPNDYYGLSAGVNFSGSAEVVGVSVQFFVTSSGKLGFSFVLGVGIGSPLEVFAAISYTFSTTEDEKDDLNVPKKTSEPIPIFEKIYFNSEEFTLDEEDKNKISGVIRQMQNNDVQNNQPYNMEITGVATEKWGSRKDQDAYSRNEKLANRRASKTAEETYNQLMNYTWNKDLIDKGKITTRHEVPQTQSDDEAIRNDPENRCAEIEVTYGN